MAATCAERVIDGARTKCHRACGRMYAAPVTVPMISRKRIWSTR